MRNIDTVLEERINSSMQTIGENANPAVQMRIQRHDVPLHDEELIERSRIVHRAGLTDSDVAVCHPYFEREDGRIWVAYVREGILHVKWAENMEILSRSEWNDYWFTDYAVSCSIAFNSKAKHNARGIWEFITEEIPWVFWVTPEGQLKAKLCTPLGQYEHELAIANVTDCSAVRAPAGDYGNWDLGLTVFFLMAGQLYYRQYIDGEWCDAERVTISGLDDLTIVKIKAFNTWDYRVGVQLLTDDGKLYVLFTYTEGIGVRGSEHINMGVTATGRLFRIGYDAGYTNEHLEIGASAVGERIYGLSTIPLEAKNINYNGDWGKKIEITMDYPNSAGDVREFLLRDSNGNVYACEDIEFDDNVIRLTFVNFNMAYSASNLTVIYTKGTLMSPVVLTDSFSISFVPTNLVSPSTPPPSVVSIYNV
jgi:hypothetical protein